MFDLSNNNVKKLLPSCAKHCFSQVAASVTNLIRFLSGVARLCDSWHTCRQFAARPIVVGALTIVTRVGEFGIPTNRVPNASVKVGHKEVGKKWRPNGLGGILISRHLQLNGKLAINRIARSSVSTRGWRRIYRLKVIASGGEYILKRWPPISVNRVATRSPLSFFPSPYRSIARMKVMNRDCVPTQAREIIESIDYVHRKKFLLDWRKNSYVLVQKIGWDFSLTIINMDLNMVSFEAIKHSNNYESVTAQET